MKNQIKESDLRFRMNFIKKVSSFWLNREDKKICYISLIDAIHYYLRSYTRYINIDNTRWITIYNHCSLIHLNSKFSDKSLSNHVDSHSIRLWNNLVNFILSYGMVLFIWTLLTRMYIQFLYKSCRICFYCATSSIV